MKRLVVVVALAALLLPPVTAQEEPADPLAAAVEGLFRAHGVEGEKAAIDGIVALSPDPATVAEMLAEGPEYAKPASSGWTVREVTYPDGKERPYHLYVPGSYDPEIKSPLLFQMHGAVSLKDLRTVEEMQGQREWFQKLADEWGFLIVLPLGQQGALWWDEVGSVGLEIILDDVKRTLNVDEDKVFATGFSDGGSGAYYLGLTRPTFYAGFIPMNGHPAVAETYSGKQLYLVNNWLRPLYVLSTQDDQLYPTKSLLPYILGYIQTGVRVRFTTYPSMGHSPDYRDEQDPMIADWMNVTTRDPNPKVLCWQTADLEIGRAAWVTILELGETPGAPEFEDINPIEPPATRVMIGVMIEREFEGVGAEVQSVVEESVAESVGMKDGDVIVGIDEKEIASFGDLRAALGEKRQGDPVRIRWRRGEEEMSGDGRFPPYEPKPTFGRERPSGRLDVTVDGNRIDVQQSGVKKFALDLSPDLFDLSKPIVVTTNGKEAFNGKVGPDLRHLLESYARDRDRRMLYLARLVIK